MPRRAPPRAVLAAALLLLLGACGRSALDDALLLPGPVDTEAGVGDDAGTAPAPTGSPGLPEASDTDVAPPPTQVHGLLWVTAMASALPWPDAPYLAASDGAGGVVVAGSYGTVAHFDANGRQAWTVSLRDVWAQTPPSSNPVGGLAVDASGNVLATGVGMALLSGADGRVLWKDVPTGTLDTRGAAVLGDGTLVDVGFALGEVSLGGRTLMPAPGGPFVARLDPGGGLQAFDPLEAVLPGSGGAFQAGTDAAGNLVLVTRQGLQTVDSSLKPLSLLPEKAGYGRQAWAPDGTAYGLRAQALTTLSVTRLAPDGSRLWSFDAPAALWKDGDPSEIVADGARGALAYLGSLYALDSVTGAATDLTPGGLLDAELSASLGHPGWSLSQTLFLRLVVDAQATIFVCGELLPPGQPGGSPLPFVAAMKR